MIIMEEFSEIGSTVPYDVLIHCASLMKSSDTSTANKAAYTLGIDPRLPTKILEELLQFLDKADNEGQICVCLALSHQQRLSESNLTIKMNHISALSLYPEGDIAMRQLAENLAKCSTLPHAILQQLVCMLDDTPRRQVIEALTNQSNLPSDIIGSIMSRLGSENSWIRHGAEQILRRKEFYCLVPLLSGKEWASWLKVLREKSFREKIICYIKEGHLCVEMPGVAWKFSMEDPAQKEKLREALKALDKEMEERVGDAFDDLGFAPEADLERVYVRELDVYV